MIKIILLAIVLLIASFGTAAAEDAPSIWMEQDGETIKLMVNTSADSMGFQADVNFDATQINITDVDITMGPWVTMGGLSALNHHGDYVTIALVNLVGTGVPASEHQVAAMSIDCILPGDTPVTLTNIVVTDNTLVASDLTYTCPELPPVTEDAVVSIGDGTGIVTLPITITNAVDAGSCDVTLTYDSTSVTVTSVSSGDMEYDQINIANTDAGSIRIGAYQGLALGLDDFTLMSVELAPVAGGSTCDLTLTVTTLADSAGAAIPYTISSGTYTIVVIGDIDGDGELTLGDAAYIAGYVIGMPGCGTINEELADVNGDGVVTIADAMYLAKCVLGVPGFTL